MLTARSQKLLLGRHLHGMSTPDDLGTIFSCMNLFLRGGSGQEEPQITSSGTAAAPAARSS